MDLFDHDKNGTISVKEFVGSLKKGSRYGEERKKYRSLWYDMDIVTELDVFFKFIYIELKR